MKILITGATGVVGEAAGRHLCGRGFEVVGVSRSIEDNECYTDTCRIDLLDEDDYPDLVEAMEGCDAVLHLAWNKSAENFDTKNVWRPNMDMFEVVLRAASEAGVPRFINGSSIHAGVGSIDAYTRSGSLEETQEPFRSSLDPDNDFDLRRDDPEKLISPLVEDPDSPYGWSKLMTERATREAVRDGLFDIGVSIRIGGVNEKDRMEKDDEPFYRTLYWSHSDLGRMLERIIGADLDERRGYHQFFGVSDNEGRVVSIENSFQ